MVNTNLAKYLFLSNIVLLLLFLIISLNENKRTLTNPESFVIRMTENGFVPKELRIKVSDRVIFLNESEAPIRIASDDHPSHQIYSEFDSKGIIKPGEKWEFLFDKTGKFGYHDHLNPVLKGTIDVLPIDGFSNSSKSENANLKKLFVTEEIKNIVKNSSPVKAWEIFKKDYENSGFEGTHDIAHYLGSLIYKDLGLDGIDYCNSSFAYGCYHGFVESLIESEGVDSLKQLTDKCRDISLVGNKASCFHGIGHGVLSYFKYDLIKTLRFCDSILSEDSSHLCWNGVFMENVFGVSISEDLKKDSHWPCNNIDKKYKEICYQYQPEFFRKKFGFDVVKISDQCNIAGLPELEVNCIKGLAHMITHNNDYPGIITKCTSLKKDEHKFFCIIYSAEEFVFQGKSYQVANDKLCNLLTNHWKEQCLEATSRRKSEKG